MTRRGPGTSHIPRSSEQRRMLEQLHSGRRAAAAAADDSDSDDSGPGDNPYWPAHDAGTLNGSVALDADDGLTQIATVSGDVTLTDIRNLDRPMSLKLIFEPDATLTLDHDVFEGDTEFRDDPRAGISFVRTAEGKITAMGKGYDVPSTRVSLRAQIAASDLLEDPSASENVGRHSFEDSANLVARLTTTLGAVPGKNISLRAVMKARAVLTRSKTLVRPVSQNISIAGASVTSSENNPRLVTLQWTGTSRPLLSPVLVRDGAVAYLAKFSVYSTRLSQGTGNWFAGVIVETAPTQGASAALAGPRLIQAWEQRFVAIVFTSGGRTCNIPGPDNGAWPAAKRDTSEPYSVASNQNPATGDTAVHQRIFNELQNLDTSSPYDYTLQFRWG